MPSWRFPLKQSVQLCLGPALSGVVTSHHPKPSIPWDSEQTVSLHPHRAHTEGLSHVRSVTSSFSLIASHWLPLMASEFPQSSLRPQSQKLSRGQMETHQAHGMDSDQTSSSQCCSVLGGEGRKGCGSLKQSWSLSADGSSHSAGFRRSWTSPPLTYYNQMLEVSCAGRWVVRLPFYFLFKTTFLLQNLNKAFIFSIKYILSLSEG